MGLTLSPTASPDPAPARPTPAGVRSGKPRMRLRHAPEYGIALLLGGFAAAVALTEPRFRTSDNLLLILEQSSTLLLVSLPFALLLMCRHIDLSVGSAIAVAGVVTSKLMAGHGDGRGWHPALVVLVVLAGAAAYGAAQGYVVTRFAVHPFVLSLGLLAALRGLANIVQGPRYAEGLPHGFLYLGQGRFRGIDIPVPVVLAAVAAVAYYIYIHHLRHGRGVQAIAGNQKAAFLAGIPVRRRIVLLYALVGLSVGLAALIQTAKLDSGPANVGNGYELTVLTAVLLGGVAFDGGRGSVLGVVLGCLFVNTFNNGLQQWGIGADTAYLMNGATLAVAAGLPPFTAWLLGKRRTPTRTREAR